MFYGRSICRSIGRSTSGLSSCVSVSRKARLPCVAGRWSYARGGQIAQICRSYGTTTIHAGLLSFGQPLHETHPHLLQPGELTPGITAQEYYDRRTCLAEKLPKGAVAVVAAAELVQRTGSCFHEFHQDPDFLYLTGFNEPEALAVIGKSQDGHGHFLHLYVREKDRKAEIWEGSRSGTQAAVDVFNADETGDISSIKTTLPRVLSDATQVFTDITQPDQGVSGLWRFLYGTPRRKTDFSELIDSRKIKQLRHIINELRAYKSPAEIELMHRVGRMSGKAHTDAMRQSFTGERDLDAYLRYKFITNGCDQIAYEPVVAGGKNGLGIHYVRNDDVLHDDEMVLIDAAGKKGGYISDITRTWPVKGKFSAAQRDLYSAVLIAQKSLVSMCRADADVSLDKLHSITENLLADNLKQIGFDMSGKAVETLFPHHISHYIGMDVHDTAGYSRKAVIRDGHCITIEPGVYVPDEDRWPKHFRNMAVRIEDSVAVGEEKPLVLTTEAVKEVKEIEALRD